jgi:hypothetical protein
MIKTAQEWVSGKTMLATLALVIGAFGGSSFSNASTKQIPEPELKTEIAVLKTEVSSVKENIKDIKDDMKELKTLIIYRNKVGN